MKSLARRGRGPLEEWGDSGRQIQSRAVMPRLLAILDLSGSMSSQDAGDLGDERRVDVLRAALEKLGDTFPNQMAMIGFNSDAFSLRPRSRMEPVGSTNLYKALQFAQEEALAVRNVVLVSDGQPTDGRMKESEEMVANWKAAGVRFSVVYCGPEGGSGEAFLQRLAAAGGGSYDRCAVKARLLVQAMERHLLAAPGGAIQL